MYPAKVRKNIKAQLKRFMMERNFPTWFRGLSLFQINSANSLMNNLRDDSEQGTCHRVRNTLINLGIEPVVSCAKIKLAMRLSRGNDMAFLWFLMELYYRHKCDDCEHSKELGYTSNEQIFMSVIAHLDTIATLREMDRLLPHQPTQLTKKKKIRKNKPKQTLVLPYFERQQRPSPYGKSLLGIQHIHVPNLGVYENYSNPNYVVPNMANRWFANYPLKEGERIAKGVIDNGINSVFEEHGENSTESTKKSIQCTFHATVEILKQKLANELKVARKKAREKYFHVDGHLKDQSYKRVIKALDEEILKAKENFSKMATVHVSCPDTSRPNTPSTKSNSDTRDSLGTKHRAPHDQKTDFFEAPTCNKPYKFNYNKIFDIRERNPVEDAVANALKTCSNIDMLTDHDEAVRECCKDIWVAEVNRYNKGVDERNKLLEEEKKAKAAQEKLGFDLPYYDPHNRKLMDALVHRVLQEIKKDKRYVLASMPEAYKNPILREFAKKRYGKIYSMKEKIKEFQRSKKIFCLLQKHENQTRMPRATDVSEKRDVSYNCKSYILRKTNNLMNRYRHNFAMELLDTTRICWAAIRPFQCTHGPPKEVFYSYLPARENDVLMFRPWKSSEYIRAKDEWDRKQAKKLLALKFN